MARSSAEYSEPDAPPKVPYTDICVRAQSNRIPVLMFHDVIKKRGRGSVWFDCTADEFESMMRWIVANGIQPISLDALYDHLTRGAEVPEKSIVLTFDDNYQGFYDYALPILEKFKFPAAMFVHTNFVGSKEGRAKMDWPTLQQLAKGDLVTIGSHTLSHPSDITKLSPADQEREIVESKKVLEEKLGKPVPYFAYPDGNNDAVSQGIVKQAGYKMAFTTHNAPAEESPNIYAVNRYVHTKYEKAWEDRNFAFDNAPASVVELRLKDAPITYETGVFEGIELALVKGGVASSLRSPSREGVLDFMRETNAVAGVNGTFFAMAAVAGTSNEMVGPCFTHNEKMWVPDMVPDRLEKIRNRPMVVWGPTSIAFFPFQGEQMNVIDPIRDFMPDFTDAFVSGALLVHNGVARTREQMEAYSAGDIMDPRKRAFVGVSPDGEIVLGASLGSVESDKFAAAIAAAGVQEAIMMDSGFSTSLVYGDKVVASGHATPTTPSRPVPHVIVLNGTLAQDPSTITVPQPPAEPVKHRRRKRRLKSAPSSEPAKESAEPQSPATTNDVNPIPPNR